MNQYTIFFDLDGTLYSYTKGHTAGLKGAYNYWAEVTGDSYEVFVNKYHLSRQKVKRFLNGTVASHSRTLYFQDMIDKHFHTSIPYHIAELGQRYWDSFIEEMTPFDGVEDTLDELHSKGYRLAVITNMSAQLQMRKLHKLNLDRHFDAVITSEEVGQEKPHPHIYLHALDRLGIKPKDAIMVGDDYAHDVEAAEFLGIRGILVTIEQEFGSIKARKAYDFSDLIKMIQELTQAPLEGVIKYQLQHTNSPTNIPDQELERLISLRDELHSLNLIGVYPDDHYLTPSVGFGNASVRYTTNGQFIVSGSQTGGMQTTSAKNYALVLEYFIEENWLVSRGPIKPSSESLTHAALYSTAPEINWVIHVHHREMWERYREFDMQTTPKVVPYGTPEMAQAIQKVYEQSPVLEQPVCMLGHTEGLITWGKSPEEAIDLYKQVLKKL